MAKIIDAKNMAATAETVSYLRDEPDQSLTAQHDFDAMSERFHRLVDKEFLGTLTPDEEEELQKLTAWHSDLTTRFYESILNQQ